MELVMKKSLPESAGRSLVWGNVATVTHIWLEYENLTTLFLQKLETLC